MAQAILCPQCEKKFSLGDHPPAQATCTQCGTLMDLTAFGGKTAPPRDTPPKAASGGTPSRRSSRGPARSGGGRRRSSSRRAPQEGPPPRRAPQQKSAATPILIFVGVLIVVLMIVVAAKRDDDDGPAGTQTADVTSEDVTSEAGTSEAGTYEGRAHADRGSQGAPQASYRSGPSAKAPAKEGDAGTSKVPRVPRNRSGKPRVNRIQLKTHAWPDEIAGATRAQADKALETVYKGGRDAVEAADWLVKQGRPMAGRIISEFRAIESNPGFDNRQGASMAANIDGMLRRIDGQIERFWDERERIRAWGAYAAPSFIQRIAKRWTWWWVEEEWKVNPHKPWDPFEDESDTAPDGIKRPEKASETKDGKKKKWGKRAGSG